jgi:hypothetical protein
MVNEILGCFGQLPGKVERRMAVKLFFQGAVAEGIERYKNLDHSQIVRKA